MWGLVVVVRCKAAQNVFWLKGSGYSASSWLVATKTVMKQFDRSWSPLPYQVEALTKVVEGDRRKMILEEVQRMGATDLVMGGKARRIMPK